MAINTSVQYNGGLLPTVGKSITPKFPILLLLSFFFNVCLVLLLSIPEVCKLTRCSSTGYHYSQLLLLSCLFSGQLKLHDGSSSWRG